MEFRDLKSQYSKYKEEIDNAIHKVIESAEFINGKEVSELESQLADFVGVKHCISCANGTEAMTLLLMAWGIKEGDAVFLPDFTFFSTGEVVSFVGATPIFVDVDIRTYNIDTDKLEKTIEMVIREGKLKPKLIIPVDLFGLPANFHEIKRISEKFNLLVLEDGAQGFGGKIDDRLACSFGDASTTSFFPAKPLGCYGDGGAIFTDNLELADLLQSLKVHGKGLSKYENIRIGVNSRLDTIQAAILKVKLSALIKHEIEDVNRIAAMYTDRLFGHVDCPFIPEGYQSSFAQYTIKLSSKSERDALQTHLKEKGIPSNIYYQYPMHSQKAFSNLEELNLDFQVTNYLCEVVLSLPMHPYMSEEEVETVSSEIIKFLKTRNNQIQ